MPHGVAHQRRSAKTGAVEAGRQCRRTRQLHAQTRIRNHPTEDLLQLRGQLKSQLKLPPFT